MMDEFDGLKIDSQLQTSLGIPEEMLERSELNIGYDELTNLWEVIVKYNGDILYIKNDLNIIVEILSERYAIVTLKKEDIFKLTLYREIEYIEQPRALALMLDTSLSSSCVSRVKQSPYNLTGKGTIVAIIDSGINYTHRDFRNEDGTTRILYIWDQTIEGNAPEGFFGGTVYDKNLIDEALGTSNPYSIVPHQDDIGHGTAVAGIACGNGRSSNGKYTGVANESSIIAIKLGERGRESFARNTEIMRAIKFILDRAIEANMPVVINLSFGTNDGSHTGTSLFETYIDDMCSMWKTSFVVATGNEGDTSNHYRSIVKSNESIEIEIEVSSSLTSLYIVLYKNFVDNFNISLISPSGIQSGVINYTSSRGQINFGNVSLFYNLGEPTPYSLEQGVFFEIISNNGFLNNGIWKIIVTGVEVVDGEFDIWLPVTEVSSKYTKFLRPNINTTLTIPSTATRVISVGGYNDLLNSIGEFSGRGFTRNNAVKPDIVAPAVDITTTSNFLGYDTLTGTSMAAPFVSGSCALLMEWGIVNRNDLFLYGERIKAFLRNGAKRKNNLTYPNPEWGYGSLCLADTLNLLEFYSTSGLKISEVNIPDENNSINQTIPYSEDYVTLIGDYNFETIRVLEEYDFIKMCKVLTGDFVVLYIEKNSLNRLTREQALRMGLQYPYVLGLMDTLALEATGVLAVQNQPFLQLKGDGVLVGIIDTGIDYTLQEFIYDDNTTKIVSIWDQSIIGNAPEGYCYGTEYTRDDINLALSSENPFNIVPSRDSIGHGTKLASVCAGFQSNDKNFIGVAPYAELVVVKLKQVNDSIRNELFIKSNIPAYSAADLMNGIQYLYDKLIEQRKPMAICIGLGTNYGIHNGLSVLEQYIYEIANKNGVSVNICTGNEGNAQHHVLVNLTSLDVEKTVELRIGEEEGFQLIFVTYASDRIGVNIISPTGESTGRIPPRNNYDQEIFLPLSNTRLRVQYYNNLYESTGQNTIITFKSPSPGIWKLNLYAENIITGDVHGWLPISNFISSGTYFLTPDPFYTATVPSTSNSCVPVGGYNSFDNSFFPESGRGPTRINTIRPYFCAPAVNVSCVGVGGNLETITGTSVAAAISTGCSALLLEWGIVKGNSPFMNSVSVAGYFIGGTTRTFNEIYPNNLWGYGRLNILGTFENI